MENTTIDWAAYLAADGTRKSGHTFNYWHGCTKVSEGCAHCYAESSADHRLHFVEWGKGKPRRLLSEATRKKPLLWNREAVALGERPRVFCASHGDVFDDEVPVEWRSGLLKLIEQCSQLDWLLLTKRPQNILSMIAEATGQDAATWLQQNPHVWIGTTVENQRTADERIPILLKVPAAIRFLSVEPQLEQINLPEDVGGLDWIINGGESGHGARPFQLEWARSLRDQCQARDIAFFFKQTGKKPFDDGRSFKVSGKGEKLQLIPVDLQIREAPGMLESAHRQSVAA